MHAPVSGKILKAEPLRDVCYPNRFPHLFMWKLLIFSNKMKSSKTCLLSLFLRFSPFLVNNEFTIGKRWIYSFEERFRRASIFLKKNF